MASTRSSQDNARAALLNGIYTRILSGKQPLTRQHGKLFLEAICVQPDPVTNFQKLIESPNGQSALRTALFCEESSEFINSDGSKFLGYLRDPNLKTVYAGSFLQTIITHITDPPIFWDAFVRNVRAGKLSDKALENFAWLLLELITLPFEKALLFYDIAQDATVRDRLDQAIQRGAQINLFRIKAIVDSKSSLIDSVDDDGPGGRHDNDSADIREISVLPTVNELECKDTPYLRRPTEIDLVKHPYRLAAHVDNQFRLLREDMLRELKEELQTIEKSPNRRRRSFSMDNLTIDGVKVSDRYRWSLKLRCAVDLFKGEPKADRHKRIKESSRHFLQHESVCCMIADGRPLVLVSIDRDEDLLAKDPSIVCVRFHAGKVLHQTLVKLKKAARIQLIQLNTAIFAYEPILKQLQRIDWLGLGDELMYSTDANPVPSDSASVSSILDSLDEDHSLNLQHSLGLRKKTSLDESQASCFRAGLTQSLSLIQGPPGECI